MKKVSILIFCVFGIFMGFSIIKTPVSNKENQMGEPPLVIYKTKKNYTKNVAIILSEDKTEIVSYPDPKDVVIKGNYCYPTPLKKCFLLDNRGINKNVAFLSITYEEYAKLKTSPSIDEMKKMIIDKDPLTKMYICGNRYQYKNLTEELNQIIKKRCKTCIKIK